MAITKILIIGSWELCIAIINAFFPPEATDGADNIGITILTYPSQTLSLPKHVPSSCIRHKTSDFSSPSLQTTFKNHDIVISTISGGDSALQKLIIDATIAAGVSRFIPHEFGHDTLSEEVQSRITKYAGRARVIEYLRSVALRNKDFEWTAIATGYTLDSALLSGNLGFDLTWHSATVHGSGTEAFAASSLNRVGQVVKRVITKWDDFKNQYIYAAGCITSANKILVALEKATRQEFSVGNHDVKDCVREGNSRIEKGFLDAGMVLLERSVLYDEQLGAVKAFTERTANRLLGLEEENVEVVVEHVVHDLKHRGTPNCGCR